MSNDTLFSSLLNANPQNLTNLEKKIFFVKKVHSREYILAINLVITVRVNNTVDSQDCWEVKMKMSIFFN